MRAFCFYGNPAAGNKQPATHPEAFLQRHFPPGKNGGLSTALSTFAHFVSPAALCGKIPRAQPGRVCLSRRRLPLRRMNQHINTGGIHGFNSLADKLTAAFPHAEDNGARPSAAICRAVSATRRKACRGGPERVCAGFCFNGFSNFYAAV